MGLRKVLLAASLNCLGHQGSQSEPDFSCPFPGLNRTFLCLLLLQLPTSVCLSLGASGYFYVGKKIPQLISFLFSFFGFIFGCIGSLFHHAESFIAAHWTLQLAHGLSSCGAKA